MKILESVKLVQFYLYDKEDLRIGRHTGVVGPNGTGKSTLMDAIQIAIMGANTRLIALNAQADEKHMTRSLRSYCLGQYGDTPEDRVRSASTTYISLIWRDTLTGAPISTGVCIAAASDSEQHTVLGRYILHNVELSMSDHVQMIDGQEHPREWGVFRQNIVDRARVSGDNPIYPDSEKYIRALLLALRGSGGVPSLDAFTRALRFGLRMRFNKTVDEIVRHDVLESRPTNIKQFKQLTDSFKRLSELVAQVKAKIEEGQKVIEEFDKAEAESSKSVTWSAIAADTAREMANEAREHAIITRATKEETVREYTVRLEEAKDEDSQLQKNVQHLRNLRENHVAHKTHGDLQRRIDEAKSNSSSKELHLIQSIRDIQLLLKKPTLSQYLPHQAAKLQSVEREVATLLNGDFPSKTILSQALERAVEVLANCFNELFNVKGQLGSEIAELEASIIACKEDLARVSTGKPRLSENVSYLLRHLRNNGLNPQPVCDLVHVTDHKWQPVIEAYLGANREALLIQEEQERDAFKIYRGLSNLYGVKLARESTQDLSSRYASGSAAELIEGDNLAAVAYLRSKLGNLMRAETNEEALGGGRTLTKDGMLVSHGEIDRIRVLKEHEFRMGIVAADQAKIITHEITLLEKKLEELKIKQSTIHELVTQLFSYSNKRLKINEMLETWDTCSKYQQAQQSLELALASSADQEYIKLGNELNNAEEALRRLRGQIEKLAGEVGGAKTELESALKHEIVAIEAADVATQIAEEARRHSEYNLAYASEQWEKLLERYSCDYSQMKSHAERSASIASRAKEAAAQRGSSAIGMFVQKHREQISHEVTNDWRLAATWVRNLVKRLSETDLIAHQEEMDEAYRASQETFRTDVAIALNNNIEWLDQSMDRLNKALRRCPSFSNGERYQFSRKVRPHLQSLLGFIQDVAATGAANDLFGTTSEIPPEFKELLDDKIATGGAGTRSPLDDYREFFEFEIDILREDPESRRAKVVGKLSKRLGTGSGGEHRAPLYVIAGAALASAYRLDEGHRDGLGLILLDEAFNKMDITNITATMRYLEDLGLQVVMASPGENLGTLMAFLHRYYDILRDPDRNVVYLEGHDVSDATRQAFRSDLPEFNPDLIDAELQNITPTHHNEQTIGAT